jgi:dienelactone hydrolase
MKVMDSIMAPADLFTTIFYKPYYILRALAAFIPFMITCRRSVTKPRIFNFFQALRQSPETANMKIGAAGFCWGGQHVVLLAQDTPSSRVQRAGDGSGQISSLIDAGFTGHPSSIDVPQEIESVTIPLSIAVGDVDSVMKKEQVYQTKEILEKKKAGDHEVVVYPGATHGFAVRGDPRDPAARQKQEKAEAQALSWFARWLG